MSQNPEVPPEYLQIIDLAIKDGWLDMDWANRNFAHATQKSTETGQGASVIGQAEFLTDPAFFHLPSSPKFDTAGYIALYPDVKNFELHPLLHFLGFGWHENRLPIPVFDQDALWKMATGCKTWIETHELSMTGAPLWLFEVLEQDPKHTEHVAVASSVPGPLADPIRRTCKSVLLHGQTILRAQDTSQMHDMIDRLADVMQQAGIEIVIANSVMSVLAIAAANKIGLPCVMIVHEPNPDEMIAQQPPYIQDAIFDAIRTADHCIFVANSSETAWTQHARPQKSHVIEKALPLTHLGDRDHGRLLAACKPDDVMILSVGTLCERKGQLDLVAALETLNDQGRASHLRAVFVGYHPSPYAEDVNRRCQALKSQGVQVFTLPQSMQFADRIRIMHMFAAADIFVMTSRAESLPRTTQEAQASGCAVISTNVDGIGAMVSDGVDGLLYQPEDIQNLARHIDALAQDPSQRRRLADTAQSRIDPDDFAKMCATLTDLIATLRSA